MPGAVTAEQVLYECLVAYGSGTRGLPTRRAAVEDLITFFKGKFATALQRDPVRFTNQDDAHIVEKVFVLRCAEAIGRLAALNATSRGVIAIAVQDVVAARIAVVNANSPNPGDWCN